MAIETNYLRGVAFIGAVHQHPVEVADAAGAPQNMAGWDLSYVLRTLADVLVFSKATGGAGVVIGNGVGTNSKATVTWDRADTQTALEGWHNWALHRTDNPNDQPVAYGRIYLTKVAQQIGP